MRLFTAISVPDYVTESLWLFTAPIRSTLPARWSPQSNLHITTKFIGEWHDHKVDELIQALESVVVESFEIKLADLGYFPKVLWVGIERSPALLRLASDTEETLSRLGCARERRAYTPHLTLAREKPGTSLKHLAELSLPAIPPFPAEAFHLYRSSSGVYTRLHSFGLVRSSK
jgi:RNA 2',3'-cyclic 3'-phosphodiesterase